MKSLLAVVVALLLAALMIGGLYMANRHNYESGRRKNCQAVPEARLAELKVGLPPGSETCGGDGWKEDSRRESYNFDAIVAKPGPVCLVSVGVVGCPSLSASSLAVTIAMADAGWDGVAAPKGATSDESHEALEFVGPGGRAKIMVSKASWEVVAMVEVYPRRPNERAGR